MMVHIAQWLQSLPQYKTISVKVQDVNGDTHVLDIGPDTKSCRFQDIQMISARKSTARYTTKRPRWYKQWQPHLVQGLQVDASRVHRFIRLPDGQRFVLEDLGQTESVTLKRRLLLGNLDPKLLEPEGRVINLDDYQLVPKIWGDKIEAGLYLMMLSTNVYKVVVLT